MCKVGKPRPFPPAEKTKVQIGTHSSPYCSLARDVLSFFYATHESPRMLEGEEGVIDASVMQDW